MRLLSFSLWTKPFHSLMISLSTQPDDHEFSINFHLFWQVHDNQSTEIGIILKYSRRDYDSDRRLELIVIDVSRRSWYEGNEWVMYVIPRLRQQTPDDRFQISTSRREGWWILYCSRLLSSPSISHIDTCRHLVARRVNSDGCQYKYGYIG